MQERPSFSILEMCLSGGCIAAAISLAIYTVKLLVDHDWCAALQFGGLTLLWGAGILDPLNVLRGGLPFLWRGGQNLGDPGWLVRGLCFCGGLLSVVGWCLAQDGLP
ncbi:MAG: hypothetical protein JOY84_15605 [Curvibacter sp.]|nr:hypothetical protein [Curvibacter sp.]